MPYIPPVQLPHLHPLDDGLLAAVTAGEARLTHEQGLALLREAPLHTLGRWADARCRALHGASIRTYVIDRNINYTNVCTAKCTFCAFRRDATDHDKYELTHEQIYAKIEELVAIGGTQILMQGGMNPALPLSWYEELLRGIKERFGPRGSNGMASGGAPGTAYGVHIHGFSPPEFVEFVRFFDPPGDGLFEKSRWVLARLRDAGLDSVPGGGGEIFAPHVRRKIGLGKCSGEEWLTVMHAAHSLGMRTSATMMFGHIEGLADRIHHLALVREWQDRALAEFGGGATDSAGRTAPGGQYQAFISWPFQRENTPMGRLRNWGEATEDMEPGAEFPGDIAALLDESERGDLGRTHPRFGRSLRMAGAIEYLRTQAVSRLMLDNVYSIGASWVTMGPHVGQVALAYGANDMGSVMMEENVVSSAGTTYCLNEHVLCRLIREAGFTPAQRDNAYDLLKVHDASMADAPGYCPDLKVRDWSEHRVKRLHVQAPKQAKPVKALTVESKPIEASATASR